MSLYQKQLLSLQKTLSSLGIDFCIEEIDKELLSQFPCAATRNQIRLHGYPSNFALDNHPNGFHFYGITQIKANHEYDYSDIGHTGSYKRQNTLLISNANGSGQIYWQPWFTSKWEFYIAENMAQFFLMLETFSLLFFEEYKNAIRDENFNIVTKKCNTIRYEITKITKDERVANDFLRFMLTNGLLKA